MSKRHMLIVDDNYGLREALRSVFEDEYDLSFAENGEQALRATFARKPEVVLMDYRMPGMDGIETMEYLHKMVPDSQTVIMSAYDDQTSVADFYRHGAFDVVSKPFNVSEVKTVMDSAAAQVTKIRNYSQSVKVRSNQVVTQSEVDAMIDDTLRVACL
jgi:DNA-binding NtrC family response regulator